MDNINLDAERAVLGSCLLDREAILAVREVVDSTDYALERHALIHEAMLHCVSQKTPPDLVTVADVLRVRGQLADVGGFSFLSELSNEVPTAVHAVYYARIVAELGQKRRLADRLHEMHQRLERGQSADGVLRELESITSVEKRIIPGRDKWADSIADATAIWKKAFKPKPFIVEDILPMGTTLLHGEPKARKTWTAMNIACAVAAGGKALGHFQAMRGEVLYIDGEMGEELINERLRVFFPDSSPPAGLTFAFEWPRIGQGFEEQLASYLEARPYTRLVIIDTIVRFKPVMAGRNIYDEEAHLIQPLTKFCNGRDIALLMMHHSKKGKFGVIEGASGSHGLTGSVDSVAGMWLHEQDKTIGHMELRGRRIRMDDVMELHWDAQFAQWNYGGPVKVKPKLSPEREKLREVIATNPGLVAKQIAELAGMPFNSVRRLLYGMTQQRQIWNAQGFYYVSDEEDDA